MKKQILDRYSRTPDNKLMIEIAAGKVEDLYHDFDKHAPYIKKDLDQDLVEYIINAVSEIGKEEFVIEFRFPTRCDEKLMSRVKTSIHNYFLYMQELGFRELGRMRRSFAILFFIGLVILFLSEGFSRTTAGSEGVISQVFSEGLTVAAWVSLWNAIAIFLINWAPHRRQIKIYEKISKAPILFHQHPIESELAPGKD